MKALLKQIAHEVIDAAKWARWRIQRPHYPAGDQKLLHLGCGNINHPGFINIDARPAPHVHLVQGIAKLDGFADRSVDMVYACHCLEHIPHNEVKDVLTEWFRVIKTNGIIRLSVPDFDLLAEIYVSSERDIRSIQAPLMGAQDYPHNFHYSAFTFNELSRLLMEAGFRLPRRWHFGTDALTSLPDWSGRNLLVGGKEYPVSLNIEATR